MMQTPALSSQSFDTAQLSSTATVSQKPRILYVITRAERGGAQTHLLILLSELRREFDLGLAVGEEGFLTAEAQRLGIEVFVIPELTRSVSFLRDLQATKAVAATIRDFRANLMHAHSSKAGVIGRLASTITGVPSVFTVHGWAFADGATTGRKLVAIPTEWFASKFGTHTITVSSSDEALARRFGMHRRGNIATIHNAVYEPRLHAKPEKQPPVVTMVARFCYQKDHSTLLKALSQINTEYSLWLIGDGPNRSSLEKQVNELGLHERTTFFGTVSDPSELLARSQVLVLTSRYEGLPMSILEGMSLGLPTIATDVGGVRELIKDGETGYLVRKENIESVRSALQRMLVDPGLRRAFGRAAKDRCRQHFSVQQMTAQTSATYRSILINSRS